MNRDRPSNKDKKPTGLEPKDDQTQWLAWTLQLAAGFFVGFGVGYKAGRLLLRLTSNEILLMAAAAGLVCGAFTSGYGNRIWMARSIFMAEEPLPSGNARACSMVIGGIGVAVGFLTL